VTQQSFCIDPAAGTACNAYPEALPGSLGPLTTTERVRGWATTWRV